MITFLIDENLPRTFKVKGHYKFVYIVDYGHQLSDTYYSADLVF